MNHVIKLLALAASLFAPPALAGGLQLIATLGYQGLTKGNRCAPGANAAFRRAAMKARRARRG